MPQTPPDATPPDGSVAVWLELGESMELLQRPDEALACYARAVEADPAAVEGLLRLLRLAATRGDPVVEPAASALLALDPPDRRALRAAGTALAASPWVALASECMAAGFAGEGASAGTAAEEAVFAELLANAGRLQEAADRYRRALALAPEWPELHNNLGLLLRRLDDGAAARACLERAVALRPAYVAALYNLGNLLAAPGTVDDARARYAQVLALEQAHAGALHGLAQVTRDAEQRVALYRRALAADPGLTESRVGLVEAQLEACDWTDLETAIEALRRQVRESAGATVAPFGFLGLTTCAAEQQQCARNWVQTRVLPRVAQATAGAAPFSHAGGERTRLRIGYLSADFRDHVMGRLLVDLFPAHDRSRVEVVGLSCGPDDGSEVRARLSAGCDRFIDLAGTGAAALAARIHDERIDVLIDLTGFTEGSRSEALALRPAPVQVSWLGYPGTMGAPFIDAIFCDPVLVPAAHQPWYDEAIVHLPGVYQPAPALPAGAAVPAIDGSGRAALGLPSDGIVFSCFNASRKLRPAMFDCWLRILSRVDGSVLWLAIDGEGARQRLRAVAAGRGVDPARLVFAPMLDFDRHLARLPAADLFLDCHPYSAGATASQCIAAGVPLLTLTGETYVSRMATALLSSIGCADLACSTMEDYEALAVALASDPAGLARLRARVRAGAAASPLFDPLAHARGVEDACLALWHAFCRQCRHEPQTRHSLPIPGRSRQSLP